MYFIIYPMTIQSQFVIDKIRFEKLDNFLSIFRFWKSLLQYCFQVLIYILAFCSDFDYN